MPAAYCLSITAVQGQPHHRLACSAALLVSTYSITEDVNCWYLQLLHCICWANICECTLATNLQQPKDQAMLIVLNSNQYLLFSYQLYICHQSN